MRCKSLVVLIVLAINLPVAAGAAQLVLPLERPSYYCDEPIELAVAGLTKGATARVELVPQKSAASPVSSTVKGEGSTVLLVLPPGSLAPGQYVIKLDGREAAKLTIAGGVRESTFLVSQTVAWDQIRPSGGDFLVGNAFSFGRLTHGAPMTTDLRSVRSAGMSAFDRAIAEDLPTLCYMYWTGYVTHKPFGSEKSWASADMTRAMRLLSFHTGQRLRRFARNIISVGTLDEPGLSWGKTPAGGMASGFPNWDEKPWYEARGWQYTQDPASRPDDDWMKYMVIRSAILREQNAQAAKDLRASWPRVVFSTDLYALHAIMDGADALNQQVNDFPSSHVFVDWGIDRLGAYSGIMLEKACDPTAKLAHAMNGQLFGKTVGQPGQRYAYRACLNGMLAAGLASNWWLNTGGMSPADLAAVNGPAKRFGPMLREMSPAGHDVAVLWSFTEIAMRQKGMAAKEAAKKAGQQIKLMIASLPENTAIKGKEIEINAYSVGQDYKEGVLAAHYALARAGYPAHIVDERVLPRLFKNYKTLVIVGQTFPLSGPAKEAIAALVRSGGKIVIDRSTTIPVENAIVADVNLRGLSYRWGPLFNQDPKSFKNLREASYYQTNHFMDEPVRQAVGPLKAAMRKTGSAARLETDSNELLAEHHLGGEGQLYLVVNGYEELPRTADADSYPIYNYAPQRARFSLKGLPEKCAVWAIEGGDWSKIGPVADARAPIDATFEPGEMKMFLVAPRTPHALRLSAASSAAAGSIDVKAGIEDAKVPWPLRVTLKDPAGKVLYQVFRATAADGVYFERFPVGLNAPEGAYVVSVEAPLVSLAAEARVQRQAESPTPQVVADRVRIFDPEAIRQFLAGKPAVVIAISGHLHRAAADRLAAGLAALGVRAIVRSESEVLHKVRYPRVWNPYVKLYRAAGPARSLEGKKVDMRINLSIDAAGAVRCKTEDGKDLGLEWRQPHALVTVAESGYVDWSGDAEVCYGPGVELYVDEQRRVTVVRGEATEERATESFKAAWSRPWDQLTSHVGGYQLPPQLPEAYTTDHHLILLGDSTTSAAVAALQASDLLPQVADAAYPGPGKALVSFVWSPFAVERNVCLIAASDSTGLAAGVEKLLALLSRE